MQHMEILLNTYASEATPSTGPYASSPTTTLSSTSSSFFIKDILSR